MTFLKKFKSDLASQVNTLLDGLRGRHVKRSRLFNVFPPLEDLERAIAEEVDALAVQGRTTHSLALARAVAGRLDVAPDHTIRGIVPGSIAAWLTWPMDFPTLCWLVPDVIKASLIGTLKAEAFETGPPHADRPALVAALDADIRDLEHKHATLADEAAAEGIPVPLLPEEAARRLREQRHQEFVAAQNRVNADAIRRGAAEPMR